MIAYVHTSVVLRKLLGEPRPLPEWGRIDAAYASRLLPTELGRVIDRIRLAGKVDDEQVASLHDEANRVLRSIELMQVTDAVLARAAGPLPAALGTLDAIHLATALDLAPTLDGLLVVATRDVGLARAARACGSRVRADGLRGLTLDHLAGVAQDELGGVAQNLGR